MYKCAFKNLVMRTKHILRTIVKKYSPTVFASSLAAEDMVLTDMILRDNLKIRIFTLNTERLHVDTVNMLRRIQDTYNYTIIQFFPEPMAVLDYIKQYGLDGIYDSVDLRKKCCEIRKLEPLKRALATNKSWITGRRKAQSATRFALNIKEHDVVHNMIKFNPLANWSTHDVWQYIRNNQVPYNLLHDQGYSSIGCMPCTRAIRPGEDIRAGRWWWENSKLKECGLHLVHGKVIRKNYST